MRVERRQFERVAVHESIIVFDERGRRLGPLLDAGGGGVGVRLDDAEATAQFHSGERLDVTVAKPGRKLRQTFGVVVRNFSQGRLGLEFANHKIGRAVLALCLLAGFSGVTSRAAAASPPLPANHAATRGLPAALAAPEAQFALFVLMNQTRADAGLYPLAWDDRVAQAALGHAQVMAQRGSLSHQFEGEPELRERLSASGVRLDHASENVVYDLDVESAHENFLGSEHHRANILDPNVDAVGIGVAEAGGILYVAEDFTHRVLDVSDERAEAMIAEAFSNLRQSSGGDPLQFVADRRLHEAAQAMAQNEEPEAAPALALLSGHSVAAYATRTPAILPPSVTHFGIAEGATHFSVGVHFARTPKYPNGFYWVAIALF